MILHGIALAGLISQCAPSVAPSTMTAIVQVESGGDPWVIDDDTTRQSYYPRDRASAEALAHRLVAAGHQVDVGLAQIDSVNFPVLGVSLDTIFDPCTNLRAGSNILASDFARAVERYGPGEIALRHAIEMYNTGHWDEGTSYLRRVLAAAGILEQKGGSPQGASERAAIGSSIIVRASIMQQSVLDASRGAALPSSAPILLTISRPSRLTVF